MSTPDDGGMKIVRRDKGTEISDDVAGSLPDHVVFAGRTRVPEQRTVTKPDTVRLTANLPPDAAAELAATAAATGFNKLTTLTRAIRVFAELVRVDRAGGEVIIKEADGSRSRLLLR